MIHAEAKGKDVEVQLTGGTVDILREITGAVCGLADSLSKATGDSVIETGSWVMSKLTEGVAAQIRAEKKKNAAE